MGHRLLRRAAQGRRVQLLRQRAALQVHGGPPSTCVAFLSVPLTLLFFSVLL